MFIMVHVSWVHDFNRDVMVVSAFKKGLKVSPMNMFFDDENM